MDTIGIPHCVSFVPVHHRSSSSIVSRRGRYLFLTKNKYLIINHRSVVTPFLDSHTIKYNERISCHLSHNLYSIKCRCVFIPTDEHRCVGIKTILFYVYDIWSTKRWWKAWWLFVQGTYQKPVLQLNELLELVIVTLVLSILSSLSWLCHNIFTRAFRIVDMCSQKDQMHGRNFQTTVSNGRLFFC